MGRLLNGSVVVLMVTSSPRGLMLHATPPRSFAARAPVPCGRPLLTPASTQETLKHSKCVWLSLLWRSLFLSLDSDAHKGFVCTLPASLVWGLILNAISPILQSCSLLLCPWTGVSFSCGIQCSPVDGCLPSAGCDFGVLAEVEARSSTPPSWQLWFTYCIVTIFKKIKLMSHVIA